MLDCSKVITYLLSMKPEIVIYWARRDFRFSDNPALYSAVEYSKKQNIDFIPIYILDVDIVSKPELNIGSNRKQLLAFYLSRFASNFKQFEICCGKPVDIFGKLLEYYQINLFFNDDIEPYAIKRDSEVIDLINNTGKTHVFNDQLSVPKDTKSQNGTIYSVFTPFKNSIIQNFLSTNVYPQPNFDNLSYNSDLNSLNKLEIINTNQDIVLIEQDILSRITNPSDNVLHLANCKIDLNGIIGQTDLTPYKISEQQAITNFNHFIEIKILNYKNGRDNLGQDTLSQKPTSRISFALKWGLVSSRQLKDLILRKYTIDQILTNSNLESYISELLWREFYKYILFNFPFVLDTEFQSKHRNNIKWVTDTLALDRFMSWIKGETGYKLVDAAMKQIISEGWMHNRSRMVVASILTKNLGVDWRWGQEYFRLLLVDLDEASNNGGWQWAASVGADPKPIRIFNPYIQAEKFDSEGLYQSKWLSSSSILPSAPIVDHTTARQEAMKRYGLGS